MIAAVVVTAGVRELLLLAKLLLLMRLVDHGAPLIYLLVSYPQLLGHNYSLTVNFRLLSYRVAGAMMAAWKQRGCGATTKPCVEPAQAQPPGCRRPNS